MLALKTCKTYSDGVTNCPFVKQTGRSFIYYEAMIKRICNNRGDEDKSHLYIAIERVSPFQFENLGNIFIPRP